MNWITETERLHFRQFSTDDAPFILELLNTPGWLRFIGDRGVKTEDDARAYLQNRLMPSYATHGHGFWHISRKSDGRPVGMCGFIHRDFLDAPDIGYALLPQFFGQGFAGEMIDSTLQLAENQWKIPHIVAVVSPDNERSIALLERRGFAFEKMVRFPDATEEIRQYRRDLGA